MENDDLSRIKNGEMSVFEAVLDKYRPLINSEAQSIMNSFYAVKDRLDIDDLKQEAMIALFSAACSYTEGMGEVSFGLYAKICIHNRLVSYIRKHKKHFSQTILPLDTATDESEFSEKERLIQEEPEVSLLANERFEQIIKFLNEAITDYEKRVFVLYLDNYTYSEIAKLVSRDVKSVDNAISRVKSKIRDTFL